MAFRILLLCAVSARTHLQHFNSALWPGCIALAKMYLQKHRSRDLRQLLEFLLLRNTWCKNRASNRNGFPILREALFNNSATF